MIASFSRKRLLRILNWMLLAVGFFAGALVALTLVENRRGEKAWNAYRSAQRGTKLNLSEFIQPPIPDADNFAASPLFNEAFEEMPEAITERLTLPLQGKPSAVFSSLAELPPADLTDWQNYFIKSKFLSTPGPSAADGVLIALQRYSPVLDSLHEAGLRPGSRFPVPWEKGFKMPQPLMVIYLASQLRALRLCAHLEKKESALAYEEWRDILRMYRALEREPFFLASGIRRGLVFQLSKAARLGLNTGAWENAELNKMATDLATLRILEDYQFAVESERGLLNQHADQLSAVPLRQRGRLFNSSDPKDLLGIDLAASKFQAFFERWMPAGWYRQNQLAANRWIDALLARVDSRSERLNFNEKSPASSDWVLQRNPRLFCFLFQDSAYLFGSIENQYVSTWTAVQFARTVIALERYRGAHVGQYPESLEALVPDYLPSIPRELFVDLPFLYRKTEGGRFSLYSRGLNQTDDGGSSDLKKTVTQQRVWVWSYQAAQP